MQKIKQSKQLGSANIWMIVSILLILLSISVSVLAYWSYTNYIDQKTNVDSKIASAVAAGKKDQADLDESKFLDREKSPYREFVGPDDYGRVTFNYPKTWSLYVAQDASNGGEYEAYFNPIIVPAVSGSELYALRVNIQQQDYDQAITQFSGQIDSGDLTSKPYIVDGSTGTRFDGKFSEDMRGSLVLFKIRDKTLSIRTDAITFTTDFDTLIASIKFNQ